VETKTPSANAQRGYSDRSFWKKLRRYARLAGKEVVEKALTLYFTLQDPDTPVWAKRVVIGALAYFIIPFDAITDLLPLVGFTDDLGALLTALSTVAMHVKPVHKQRAKEQAEAWFPLEVVSVQVRVEPPKALPE
jgi:uncharacterized membrane protein YkvA (DUF1232 family)